MIRFLGGGVGTFFRFFLTNSNPLRSWGVRRLGFLALIDLKIHAADILKKILVLVAGGNRAAIEAITLDVLTTQCRKSL